MLYQVRSPFFHFTAVQHIFWAAKKNLLKCKNIRSAQEWHETELSPLWYASVHLCRFNFHQGERNSLNFCGPPSPSWSHLCIIGHSGRWSCTWDTWKIQKRPRRYSSQETGPQRPFCVSLYSSNWTKLSPKSKNHQVRRTIHISMQR